MGSTASHMRHVDALKTRRAQRPWLLHVLSELVVLVVASHTPHPQLPSPRLHLLLLLFFILLFGGIVCHQNGLLDILFFAMYIRMMLLFFLASLDHFPR